MREVSLTMFENKLYVALCCAHESSFPSPTRFQDMEYAVCLWVSIKSHKFKLSHVHSVVGLKHFFPMMVSFPLVI